MSAKSRGRNNNQSTDMTDKILPFICPEFSVISEMTNLFLFEYCAYMNITMCLKFSKHTWV